MSKIEWTTETWNPLVGCSRVSEGCRHCYAERQAFRAAAMGISRYDGITKKVGDEIRWTGKVALVESALDRPLRWKKPRKIFVNSMSDLFHEAVPDEWIDRIFAVMATATRHEFQILTKRPERMAAYCRELADRKRPLPPIWDEELKRNRLWTGMPANIWLGVSVEDQETADERITLLLQTPAAIRWVSYEPALGPVDFSRWLPERGTFIAFDEQAAAAYGVRRGEVTQAIIRRDPRLDWIVVGGESGPGARPFDLSWARQTIAQCRAAGVAPFFKQAGSRPFVDGTSLRLKNSKGGDMDEWPEDLRVREYPRSMVKVMAEAER